ncbi:MAG TPA: adenylate/guanylate cyclase domain-containing protein [Terriglobales bacterium]|nr:adenylate/guanylate cyclase domain-containing protein [Terriglobales bacterium]
MLLAWAVVAAVYLSRETAFVSDVRWWGYDLLVNLASPAPRAAGIVVVDFDDDTVLTLKTWPVPRTVVADVLRRVAAGKPDLIGLDILLTEARNEKGDQELAAAIAEAQNVIVGSVAGSAGVPAQNPLPAICEVDEQAASNCKAGAALGVGFINMPVDDDGFIRRMFLLPARDSNVLSFPAALAVNFRRTPIEPVPGQPRIRFGPAMIPLAEQNFNTALIGTWSPQPARTVSARTLLQPGFDASQFAGKVVLIGQSSAAGADRHTTPLFRRRYGGVRPQLAGTQIQAASLNSLLTGRVVAPVSGRVNWAILIVVALVAMFAIVTRRAAAGVLTTLTLMALLIGGAQAAFTLGQRWFDWVPVEFALLLGLPVGYGYRFLREQLLHSATQRERAELMGLFSRYVAPEVAAEIWDRRGEVVLAGKEVVATVLFSDIRNFTRNTAGKPSAEVLAWLNEYFTAMAEEIQVRGGFLNKFIGDGIMAVYGVPISQGAEADACAAVEAALAMVERAAKLAAEHAGDPAFPRDLRIGVGIHTGPLTAGNVGAATRLEYSVIGETVNLASRLESANKDLGTDIAVSPATYELVKHKCALAPAGEVEVKGFEGKILIYTAAAADAAGTK